MAHLLYYFKIPGLGYKFLTIEVYRNCINSLLYYKYTILEGLSI